MDSPDDTVGLCATCRHGRMVPAARSSFYLCVRSFTDARFHKYPVLPVIRCVGYERQRDKLPSGKDQADEDKTGG